MNIFETKFIFNVCLQYFRVIVQFQLRFYTVLFLSLLIALIIDASFENYIMKQTETDAPLKGIRNTIQHGKQIFIYLVNLRKEHPGTVRKFLYYFY